MVFAQDEPQPKPLPGMRITFLPPPMEGTLSLGIYDKKGKLVRVMAREATEKDFVVGLNGLIIYWDGKDDSGKVMPPGVYYARGYSVGAIDVEGVGYHGNDWITEDDSPHIHKITTLFRSVSAYNGAVVPGFEFDAQTAAGADIGVICDAGSGKITNIATPQASLMDPPIPYGTPKPGDKPNETERQIGYEGNHGNEIEKKESHTWSYGIRKGKVFRRTDAGWEELNLPSLENAIDVTIGESENVHESEELWVIDRTAQGTLVKSFEIKFTSRDAELKRRLVIEPGEPIPTQIAAGYGEVLVLMEEQPGLQRIRALKFLQTVDGPSPENKISEWKTTVSKSIIASDTFDAVKNLLHQPDGKPFKAEPEFIVNLVENPLLKNEPTTAHVSIGFNDHGSFLQTTDGLPLRRITETPNLKWAVIGREGSGKQLTIFQSDGAVVEEFKARRLALMMAFDAGDYEWTGK
ncbi:MAG TPA: hypothetical protein VGM54_09710 [Chthoniobacter sp.]